MIKIFIFIIFFYIIYGFIKNLTQLKSKKEKDSDVIDAEYEEIE